MNKCQKDIRSTRRIFYANKIIEYESLGENKCIRDLEAEINKNLDVYEYNSIN